jgi:thiamine-monophosphate kinase
VQLDELSIIDRYFRPLAGKGAFGLFDDAGLIAVPRGEELVITTDMLASDVHFLAGDPPDTIARKALRVNLSDLAAKGATPLAYVLSLALTPDLDAAWLTGFANGLAADQKRYRVTLLGGDTIAVPERPVISITAFGHIAAGRMVHRAGGRPGDDLYVSGAIGGGAAGLALLRGEAGPWSALAEDERDALVGRYRLPEPRTALAPALVEFATAAMDVSDGLVGDCDKLCAASGCSAVIRAEAVPLPGGLAGTIDPKLVARLLTAGDDFEILATVAPENAPRFKAAAENAGVPLTRIGTLAGGEGPAKVLFQGTELGLSQRAFVHRRVETAK